MRLIKSASMSKDHPWILLFYRLISSQIFTAKSWSCCCRFCCKTRVESIWGEVVRARAWSLPLRNHLFRDIPNLFTIALMFEHNLPAKILWISLHDPLLICGPKSVAFNFFLFSIPNGSNLLHSFRNALLLEWSLFGIIFQNFHHFFITILRNFWFFIGLPLAFNRQYIFRRQSFWHDRIL